MVMKILGFDGYEHPYWLSVNVEDYPGSVVGGRNGGLARSSGYATEREVNGFGGADLEGNWARDGFVVGWAFNGYAPWFFDGYPIISTRVSHPNAPNDQSRGILLGYMQRDDSLRLLWRDTDTDLGTTGFGYDEFIVEQPNIPPEGWCFIEVMMLADFTNGGFRISVNEAEIFSLLGRRTSDPARNWHGRGGHAGGYIDDYYVAYSPDENLEFMGNMHAVPAPVVGLYENVWEAVPFGADPLTVVQTPDFYNQFYDRLQSGWHVDANGDVWPPIPEEERRSLWAVEPEEFAESGGVVAVAVGIFGGQGGNSRWDVVCDDDVMEWLPTTQVTYLNPAWRHWYFNRTSISKIGMVRYTGNAYISYAQGQALHRGGQIDPFPIQGGSMTALVRPRPAPISIPGL